MGIKSNTRYKVKVTPIVKPKKKLSQKARNIKAMEKYPLPGDTPRPKPKAKPKRKK